MQIGNMKEGNGTAGEVGKDTKRWLKKEGLREGKTDREGMKEGGRGGGRTLGGENEIGKKTRWGVEDGNGE